MSRPKLLYFVSEDWYFISHRLPLAEAARDKGYDVVVVTRLSDGKARLEQAGLRTVDFDVDRRSLNPFATIGSIVAFARILRRERPTIVHNVALKPAFIGGVASWLARVPNVVNAVAGLGWLYTTGGVKRWLARAIRPMLGGIFSHGTLIVQNPEDREFFHRTGVPLQQIELIRGAGVDTEQFAPSPEPPGIPVVMLAARLLWDKGVGEFVDAARQLKARGIVARFVLVGGADVGNPAAIAETAVQSWQSEGVIEWWGAKRDMPTAFRSANIVCLPSYREGLPKVLLEAAASARAIVTTNVPGCREVVIDGVTGILAEARDADSLARAIQRLLSDPKLRTRLAMSGRERVERELSLRLVIEQTLAVYHKVAPCELQ